MERRAPVAATAQTAAERRTARIILTEVWAEREQVTITLRCPIQRDPGDERLFGELTDGELERLFAAMV